MLRGRAVHHRRRFNEQPTSLRRLPQLAALATAARQEIVDVLEQMGTVSVAEMAGALGRPADALYFHLRPPRSRRAGAQGRL
jgi:predicted transcriptional regulator